MDTTLSKDRLAEIEANARLVCRTAAEELDAEIGFDRAGVQWLDGFIQRQHNQGPGQSENGGLADVLGCYLGQCIIATYGGSWRETATGLGVSFDPKHVVAYPLAKVRKHLQAGASDSVLSMFDVIPLLLDQADDGVFAAAPGSKAVAVPAKSADWLSRLFGAKRRA